MRWRLTDADQVLAEPGVVVDAVGSDDDVVLDPDAGSALEVDTGLDGDDVPGRQRVRRLRRHTWRLVHLETEPVTETMAERPGERRLVDDATRGCVGVDAGDAGANRV